MTVSSDLYNNEGVPKPVSNARYYTKVPERFQTPVVTPPVVKPPVVKPPVEQRTTFAPSAPRKTKAGRKRRGRKGRKTRRRHRK